MNEAGKLRDDYEAKLKDLQDNCYHLETEIRDYYWAPAHWGGKVEVCKRCDKIIRHLPLDSVVTYSDDESAPRARRGNDDQEDD